MLQACSPRVPLAPLFITLPDSTTAPIEYGPECAEARHMAQDSIPPKGMVLARPVRMSMPPFPFPAMDPQAVVTVKMVIDSVGRPDPASIQISGLADREYEKRFRSTLMDQRFRPALIGRCGVASRFQTGYSFSARPQ